MFVATKYNDCSDKEREVIDMSPLKKGTKLTDTPKDTMLRVRIDKETSEQLEAVSETLNLSKSEVVRKGIREQYNNIKK